MTNVSHRDNRQEKFELPKNLQKDFKEVCAEQGVSRAWVLREMVRAWTEDWRGKVPSK